MQEQVALVQRAQAGDLEAFSELVKRYQKRVFHAVWKVVRDMHLADDLSQEVFLKAHRSLPRLKDARTFGGWLHRIALNHALDRKRKLARRKDHEVSGGEFSWIQAPTDARLTELTQDVEGLRSALEQALEALPKKQRQAFELSLDPEMDHLEIAKVLGIPKGTVKSRVFHARKALYERLRPYLG